MGIDQQTSRGGSGPSDRGHERSAGAAGGYARAGLCSLRAGRVDQGDERRRRPWRRPRPRHPRPHASLADLVGQGWQNRHLFGMLGMRIRAVRFGRTKLGQAWFFIQPVMSIFGMSLIFGGILQVSPAADVPYLLFLVFGLLGFHYAQARLPRSCPSLSPPLRSRYRSRRVPRHRRGDRGRLPRRRRHDVPSVRPRDLVGRPRGLASASCSRCHLGMFTSVFNAHTRDVKFGIRYIPPVLVLPHAIGVSAESGTPGPSADRRAESDDGADRPD